MQMYVLCSEYTLDGGGGGQGGSRRRLRLWVGKIPSTLLGARAVTSEVHLLCRESLNKTIHSCLESAGGD